jgi:hypothetical protein
MGGHVLYFFYQEKEKSQWLPALASERASVIRTKKPALVSVLDVDNDFSQEMSLEEYRAVRYSGPFYVDFDAADLSEATQQFQLFLTNLKAKGVNLEMLRLFATGKKGYHIEIPAQMLMAKVPANGIPNLPSIYKEIAHVLYVDTLDLRVYSAKRGRMWRCQNVKRDNDRYKVQLTVEESFAMTGDSYDQVCSSPRNALPTEPAALDSHLGLLFAQARDKVDKGVAKAKKAKPQVASLDKFKGEWPDTLQLILQGVGLKPDVGWNYVSMQLAIVASALGKSEEDLLTDATPLIETHDGDSDRYGSPRKRRDDLKQMYRYVNGNPCYEYSAGGIIGLLMPEIRANADISFGDYVPDDKPAPAAPKTVEIDEKQADGTVVTKTVTIEPEATEEEETGPIRFAKSGIFVRCETGWAKASDIGISDPVVLKNMDETIIGYDLNVFIGGKSIGREVLPMASLISKTSFQNWTMKWSASMSASDNQTAKLADILRSKTSANKSETYVVTREGLDLIVPPGAKSEQDFDLIWSSPNEVKSLKGNSYRFRSNLDRDGTFKSDLLNAPDLTIADAELIHNLLRINTHVNVAKMLGWFSATFMTQIIRRFYRKFPSLQVFGQSGAGKSETTALLNNMHYYMAEPKALMAQGQTQYPMIVAVASSASIPVIFEEVKAREMTKTLRDFLLNLFRNNYDGHSMARGALTKDQSSKDVTVNNFGNSGPVAFVGESVEDQSAILERCIVVSLSKNHRYGKADHFNYCADRRTELGKLGKALMLNAMSLDLKELREELGRISNEVKFQLGSRAEEMARPAFNIAVVMIGLRLLKQTLNRVFGEQFDEILEDLTASLMTNVVENMPKNMAEASRVLDVMAYLSRSTDPAYQLVNGEDYTLGESGKTVDLKLRLAYAKYVKWQRSLGMEVLFDTESAFIAGMTNYAGTVQRSCPDNMRLYDSPKAIIYRLNLDYLDSEGVDAFKG